MMQEKKCSKCGCVYSLTEEYWERSSNCKDGFRNTCKNCRRKYRQEYYEANKDWFREYKQKYHEANREENLKKFRKYYEANREKLKAVQRQWNKNNREVRRKYGREYNRQYYKANKEKTYVNTQKRRARKNNLPDTLTADDWQYALNYFNGCCAVCGRQLNDLFGDHTGAMDHWIPLSSDDCPGTIPENIVPLCHGAGGCNNSKGTKDPQVWLAENYGTRKAQQIMARIQAYFVSLSDLDN